MSVDLASATKNARQRSHHHHFSPVHKILFFHPSDISPSQCVVHPHPPVTTLERRLLRMKARLCLRLHPVIPHPCLHPFPLLVFIENPFTSYICSRWPNKGSYGPKAYTYQPFPRAREVTHASLLCWWRQCISVQSTCVTYT